MWWQSQEYCFFCWHNALHWLQEHLNLCRFFVAKFLPAMLQVIPNNWGKIQKNISSFFFGTTSSFKSWQQKLKFNENLINNSKSHCKWKTLQYAENCIEHWVFCQLSKRNYFRRTWFWSFFFKKSTSEERLNSKTQTFS